MCMSPEQGGQTESGSDVILPGPPRIVDPVATLPAWTAVQEGAFWIGYRTERTSRGSMSECVSVRERRGVRSTQHDA